MSKNVRRFAAGLLVPALLLLSPISQTSAQTTPPDCSVQATTPQLIAGSWASDSGWKDAVNESALGKQIVSIRLTVKSGADSAKNAQFGLVSPTRITRTPLKPIGSTTVDATGPANRTLQMFVTRDSVQPTLTVDVELCVAGTGTNGGNNGGNNGNSSPAPTKPAVDACGDGGVAVAINPQSAEIVSGTGYQNPSRLVDDLVDNSWAPNVANPKARLPFGGTATVSKIVAHSWFAGDTGIVVQNEANPAQSWSLPPMNGAGWQTSSAVVLSPAVSLSAVTVSSSKATPTITELVFCVTGVAVTDPPKADLTVSSIALTTEAGTTCVSGAQPYGTTVKVTNIGTLESPVANVQLGTVTKTTSGSIPPGATTTVWFPETATTANAIVDPTNQIPESNETNNSRTESNMTPPGPCTLSTCNAVGRNKCVSIPFITRNKTTEQKTYVVPIFDHSEGTRSETLEGKPWAPGPGDTCTVADHNSWWVEGPDGKKYPTWHPIVDPKHGNCSYGHDHGDNPNDSPIYEFSGGVPFGYTNLVAGKRAEEDHVGHKVIVESNWKGDVNNGAGVPTAFKDAGFSCYWLSHIHQGTHSGDAVDENEHEYNVNLLCNDGQARQALGYADPLSATDRDTLLSVKLLVTFGPPNVTPVCAAEVPFETGGSGPIPLDDEARRALACVGDLDRAAYGEVEKFFTQRNAPSGEKEIQSRNSGFQELWRPGAFVTVGKDKDNPIVDMSAYYFVYDPARVVNNRRKDLPPNAVGFNLAPVSKTFVSTPQSERYLDTAKQWVPTLDICSYAPLGDPNSEFVKGYETFCNALAVKLGVSPTDPNRGALIAAKRESAQSPFKGLLRAINPKGATLNNRTNSEYLCTAPDGTNAVAATVTAGKPSCPPNQIPQRVANTVNLWTTENAKWGNSGHTGVIQGSSISTRPGLLTAGEGFEWVRLSQNEPGHELVHAPN